MPIFGPHTTQQGGSVDLVLPTGWEDIGAKGLVVLFVLMIFLGWLIPKPWVSRLMADKDKQLASKDHQLDVKDETIDRLTKAVQDLTVTAHTGPIALRSIAREADKAGGD